MTNPPSPPPPDLPAEPGTAELLGYGRVSWEQLATMLDGAQAAWADYAGFHVGPVPATPPPYTHLWAWTTQWLARARIDNGTAIVGILALDGEPRTHMAIRSWETVHFQRAPARTWPQAEKRVGQLPGHIAGRAVDIYLIPGQHPITFVTSPPDPSHTTPDDQSPQPAGP